MKIIKVLLFFLISTKLWADSGEYLWGGNFLDKLNNGISILENPIYLTDIVNLNKNDLRILRNSIFAKYGYKFKSIDLHNYFIKYSWYKAEYDNVDNRLSELDKSNISIIQKIENNYPINTNALIGLWWDPPFDRGFAVDAAGPDQFRIYPNGIFVIVYTHRGDKYIFSSGLWSYGNNILKINGEIINTEKRNSFRDGLRDTFVFNNILWWKWEDNANSVM